MLRKVGLGRKFNFFVPWRTKSCAPIKLVVGAIRSTHRGKLCQLEVESLSVMCDVLTPNCHNCKARTRSTQQPILINAYSRPMSTAHAHIYLTPSPYSVSIVSKVSEEASVFGLDISSAPDFEYWC